MAVRDYKREYKIRSQKSKDDRQHRRVARRLMAKKLGIKRLRGKDVDHKDGNPRKHIRIQYWLQNAVTYRDYFMGPSSVLDLIPDTPVEGDYLINYSANEKPLFHGHYWLETKIEPLTDNIACIDYSVAKQGGKLVAYKWDGEQTLSKDKMIFVNRVG